MTRPLRFGLQHSDGVRGGRANQDIAGTARRAEAAGYDTLLFPDHLGLTAPILGAVAAAAATSRLRVGTDVLNNDFRHAWIVVEEAATADALTGGRFELGLGAGHMRAEYERIGLHFDPAPARIARLAETAARVRDQLPSLRLLIGGNGDRLLRVAAEHADTVGITGFAPRKGGTDPTLTHFTTAGLADRIEMVRAAAGDRFGELELSVLVQQVVITDDRERGARELVEQWTADGHHVPHDVTLDSPFVLIGSREEIADQIRALRANLGVSYFVVFDGRSDGFDAVVASLAGT